MILLDNTILSNFALIRHPEFVHQAFVEEIGTTEQAFHELERGMQLGRLPKCDWTWLQQLQLTGAEETQFRLLTMHLGTGEASCFSIAFQRKYKIATDDKDARQWAMRLTIPFTGTLGILASLVKQGEMTLIEGNSWLQQMIETGYHSPILKLDELVKI
jgi:predicted nucleic acid-binding protein